MKTILFTGALAMALMLGGCGDSGTSTPPSNSGNNTKTAEQQAKDITKAVTDGTNKAAEEAKTVGTALTKKGEELLAQAGQYVKDNKWDLAEKAVAELETMKKDLPPEYAPKIDQLRSAINAAKTGNIKMPDGLKIGG